MPSRAASDLSREESRQVVGAFSQRFFSRLNPLECQPPLVRCLAALTTPAEQKFSYLQFRAALRQSNSSAHLHEPVDPLGRVLRQQEVALGACVVAPMTRPRRGRAS